MLSLYSIFRCHSPFQVLGHHLEVAMAWMKRLRLDIEKMEVLRVVGAMSRNWGWDVGYSPYRNK